MYIEYNAIQYNLILLFVEMQAELLFKKKPDWLNFNDYNRKYILEKSK